MTDIDRARLDRLRAKFSPRVIDLAGVRKLAAGDRSSVKGGRRVIADADLIADVISGKRSAPDPRRSRG